MSEDKENQEKIHQSGLPKPPPQQGYHHAFPLDEQMEKEARDKEAATGTPDINLTEDKFKE